MFQGGIRLERMVRIWSKEATVCSFQPCLENTSVVYFYKVTETRICHLRTTVKIRANTKKIDPNNTVQCINSVEEGEKIRNVNFLMQLFECNNLHFLCCKVYALVSVGPTASFPLLPALFY